jgi:[histone H4]-N-methyl-L-lysine20 N-methyltransferase
MPTPRESTPAEPAPRPSTHKFLHAVGKKLAAAAASTSAPLPIKKRKRQESPPAAATPKHKRRKTYSSIPLPAAHPRELIRKGWSRSGRKHLPSAKVREIEPIQAQKRARGRPRLHPLPASSIHAASSSSSSSSSSPPSPPAAASAPPELPFGASIAPVSPLRNAKSRAIDDQPRENNGRFGKKESTNGKFRRRVGPTPVPYRTRAQRAEGRAAAAANASHGHDAATSVKRERNHEHEHDDDFGLEEHSKRSRVSSGSGYAPTKYFTPNPMSFARKKWAPALPPPPPTHHLRSLGAPLHVDRDVRAAFAPPSSSASAPPMSSQLSPPPLPSLLGESEHPEDATDGDESDDGDWPVTPENVPEPEPNTQQDGETGHESEDNELPMSGGSTKHSLPTLWKPSPFAFAARRWASHEGGRQYEQDREHSQFFRAYSRTEQTFSTPRRGPAASWGTGTATNVSTGLGDANRAPGTGACGGGAGGTVTRVEWMQVNGTAPEFRKWDTYEADSVSSSEEEVC